MRETLTIHGAILIPLIGIACLGGASGAHGNEPGENVREALSEQKWNFVENSLQSTATIGAGKGFRLDSRFTVIGRGMAAGSFVELDDGSLLNLDSKDGGTVRISRDDGKTWAPYSKMYEGPGPGALTQDYETGLAAKTRDGVIVWVYRDYENAKFNWDHATNDAPGARRDVWSIRSLDNGKTWVDRQRIFKGYCGALIDIMETSDGDIVVPVQRFVHDPGRHIQCTYVSTDNGKHWIRSNLIDLGGSGHHDGNFEGTLTELKDGRLYMLMRTNMDRQWEAYSWDGGITWLQIQPSPIASTSSPAFITRLNSGRLALIWTDLPESGKSRSLKELNLITITEYGKKWGPDPMRLVKRHYPPGEEPDTKPLHALRVIDVKEARVKWPHLDSGRIGAGSDYWLRVASNRRDCLSISFSEDDGRTWADPIVFSKGGNRSYCQLWERRPGELWISIAIGQDRTLVKVREEDLHKGGKKQIRGER